MQFYSEETIHSNARIPIFLISNIKTILWIFQHFISHFLPTFIGSRSPKIIVNCGEETRYYPEEIESIIKNRDPISGITMRDGEEYGSFSLTLMECDSVASSDLSGNHFVHFIAHDRTVHSHKIDNKLGLKRFGDNQDRVFHAILTGDYLDKKMLGL